MPTQANIVGRRAQPSLLVVTHWETDKLSSRLPALLPGSLCSIPPIGAKGLQGESTAQGSAVAQQPTRRMARLPTTPKEVAAAYDAAEAAEDAEEARRTDIP